MTAPITQRLSEVLEGFARLLEYPADDFPAVGAAFARGLAEQCAPAAAEELQAFAAEVLQTSAEVLEEIHTRTCKSTPIIQQPFISTAGLFDLSVAMKS